MNEQQVRAIIRDEMTKQKFQSGTPDVLRHRHDNISSPKINQDNIIPGTKFNGSIDMAQATTYTIPITGNPSRIDFYGGALNVGLTPPVHAIIIGNAQIGSCYQFQPSTTTSTSLNNVKTGIIQGSAAMIMRNGEGGTGNPATSILKNSQGHIVYAEFPSGTLVAVGDVTSVSSTEIKITVSTLSSGWSISGLWVVS